MAEQQTKTNEYELSTAGKKLLEALADPENRNKSITDLCQVAGVSRDTYYKAFKKPEFIERYEILCRDLVKHSLAPIVNACIKEAKDGSYQHIRIVLEMGGLYTPRQLNELTGKDGGPITVTFVEPSE